MGRGRGGDRGRAAKAVMDMQEGLGSQALKLFSGFPYSAGGTEEARPAPAPEKPRRAARAATTRKPRARKKP